jgi:hypothetical protein
MGETVYRLKLYGLVAKNVAEGENITSRSMNIEVNPNAYPPTNPFFIKNTSFIPNEITSVPNIDITLTFVPDILYIDPLV